MPSAYEPSTYTIAQRCFMLIHDSYIYPKRLIVYDKAVYTAEAENTGGAMGREEEKRN